jgi:hypothetical protein
MLAVSGWERSGLSHQAVYVWLGGGRLGYASRSDRPMGVLRELRERILSSMYVDGFLSGVESEEHLDRLDRVGRNDTIQVGTHTVVRTSLPILETRPLKLSLNTPTQNSRRNRFRILPRPRPGPWSHQSHRESASAHYRCMTKS